MREFLTLLDQKDGGKRQLTRYICSLEQLGCLYIDDLIHIKDPEKIFKEKCDMEVGTTGFILRKCRKELQQMGAPGI